MSEQKSLNIYQRLNKVREAVDYVRKDKKVEGQGYMAVTHDAVTALVRPHLVAHGIVIMPTLLEAKMLDTGTTTGKGIPIMRYEGTYEIRFVNTDDPMDAFAIKLESHALDYGDKAPGKAISYAVKYAMLKVFSLETGEDEEGRFEGERKIQAKVHKPTDGAMESLSLKEQNRILDLVTVVKDKLKEGNSWGAYEEIQHSGIEGDADQMVAFWSNFRDPQERRTLKEMAKRAQGNATQQ